MTARLPEPAAGARLPLDLAQQHNRDPQRGYLSTRWTSFGSGGARAPGTRAGDAVSDLGRHQALARSVQLAARVVGAFLTAQVTLGLQ